MKQTIATFLGLTVIGTFVYFGMDNTPISEVEIAKIDNISYEEIEQSENYSREFSNKEIRVGKVNIPNDVIVSRADFRRELPGGQDYEPEHIFREDMAGVTFICSYLDNVFVPSGNTIVTEVNGAGCGSYKMYHRENDLENWIVDEDGNPIEPLEKEMFIRKEISIDPDDIPSERLLEPITNKI